VLGERGLSSVGLMRGEGVQVGRIGWCRAKSAESRIKFAINTKGTVGVSGTVSSVEGVCK